jgi:hypothetical protein
VVVSNNGHSEAIVADEFISSMPVTEFVKKLDPPCPDNVLQAARQLNYRDFLTVCLIVNKEHLFPDNWIYIHDPEVKVGRIQNFKNWSSFMVPDSTKTSLGLEYFCTEGDDLWIAPDADLIELAKTEVEKIGLASRADIEDGCVVRAPKAYPMYDSGYRDHLETVKQFTAGFDNFQTIGRNGLHRYNNQDHAMLTGLLAVKNAVAGDTNDLWSVNTDQEYLEEIRGEIPGDMEEVSQVLGRDRARLPKLDRWLWRIPGCDSRRTILATMALVARGGDMIGPNLQLLREYFPGYSVTVAGSFLGMLYGFFSGFVGGWSFAFLRNGSMFITMALIHRRAEWKLIQDLFRYL